MTNNIIIKAVVIDILLSLQLYVYPIISRPKDGIIGLHIHHKHNSSILLVLLLSLTIYLLLSSRS